VPATDKHSPLEPFVAKLAYRAQLSREDRAAILDLPATVCPVERRQFIAKECERATRSCLMLSGYSVRSKLTATGARQILSIHMRGEMVDLQNSMLEVADHSVQMLTDGKIAAIPVEDVKRICVERPAVALAMWINTLVDGSIFREWITKVGRRDARARIAHLLCEFSLRLKIAGLGNDSDYELPMSQEQMADATALTPVHVNRTLKGLKAEGLIDRVTPRSIRIGDWRKLTEAGDFDSNYLHLREDEPALQSV
jgi:CRP-like cAMP-binding protein